jgi:hypothetical protein
VSWRSEFLGHTSGYRRVTGDEALDDDQRDSLVGGAGGVQEVGAALVAIAVDVVMPPVALPFIGGRDDCWRMRGLCYTDAGMNADFRRETERLRGERLTRSLT